MTAAVARFSGGFYAANQRGALAKIAAVRAKESGALAAALDELYHAVSSWQCEKIDHYLTKVIEVKRTLKQHT